MKKIKKAGIIVGAVAGGIVGGTVSMIGKLSNVKFIEHIGTGIIDSTIYTGAIAGDLVCGATEIAVGTKKKDKGMIREGVNDLKSGGGKVADNVVGNVKLLASGGAEIAKGAVKRDRKRVSRGVKRLVKIIAVGVLTVGAIKISDEE